MSTTHALIPELEEALRHVSVDRYADSIQRVADFFLAGASRFNEEHVHLFDRILGRLIVAVETKVLAELARRLAPVRNAPPDVIRRLARNGEIAVAGPVLARSTRLDDADLVETAQTQGQAHRFAISGRSRVSETVTDVLVEQGDRDVVRNVAMNSGARFSEAGLARLAERAADDGILADKLAQRPDVPPHVFRDLILKARTEVQQRLLAAERPEIRAGLKHMAADISRDVADAAADAEAWRTVEALKRAGRLGEAQVLEFAESGRVKETIAALAVICHMSIALVRRLLNGDRPDAALILCQAAGFGWETARTILRARNETASRDVDDGFADLDRLSPSTAESILGFWRACDGEMRAAS
jgi:uncharacterized protein (DUF2336 family)